jgi:phenylpropionate dioxygenase-like ring-hydroxylating dioxygenase large terminal subunit/ABC-type nitrate/sulfonate/bicarbonate transport system substrate-binding protein
MRRKNGKITLADLAHVGPGTPAGEWFRRYWLAVATVADLRDIPLRVKVLGEELVLFRDPKGQIGLLGLHCPHRGTSLEYGDIEETGIRCPYHGWLFNVSGQCLEQPAEAKESTFHRKVKHLSYPMREQGGFIFAYLGPDGDDLPPLPRYFPLVDDKGLRSLEGTRHYDYNWFNFIENGADPVHFSILHRSDPNDGTWRSWFFNFKDIPPFDAVETGYGMKVVSRKPGPTPETEYVDEKSFALPSILQIGDTEFTHFKRESAALKDGSHNEHFMFLTPNDDEHFTLFTVNYYTGPDPEFFEKLAPSRELTVKEEKKAYDMRPHAPFRGSVRREDIMCQTTQTPIGARKEQLATSDRGVILLRKLILDGVKAVQEGRRPKGVLTRDRDGEVIKIDSFTGVCAKSPAVKSRAARETFGLFLAVVLSLFILTGAAFGAPLHVAYSAISGAMAPLWVAQDGDYFRREGLETQLLYIGGGSLLIQSMLGGDVQFAFGPSVPVVNATLRGADLVLIANTGNAMVFSIMSRPELKNPPDLKGKKIGVTRLGGSTDLALDFALERWGLQRGRDVTVLQTGGMPESQAGLSSGALDAAVLSSPSNFRAKKLGLYEMVDVGQLGIVFPNTPLSTRRATIRSSRDTVVKFLRAFSQGLNRLRNDKEFSLKVLAKYTRVRDPEILGELYQVYGVRHTGDPVSYVRPEGVDRILKTIESKEAREAKPGVFIDNTLLKEIEQSGFFGKLRQ